MVRHFRGFFVSVILIGAFRTRHAGLVRILDVKPECLRDPWVSICRSVFSPLLCPHAQARWFGFSAAPMPYIDAGGFHGGNLGALVRKKNFQVGG
jgi:hypothetical protein